MVVSVPGTLSNLGPGYDALGLAVSLTNRFTFRFDAPGFSAQGAPIEPDDHLTLATARRAAEAFGVELPSLHVRQEEQVPRARGLGSSATARVAGLLAAMSLRPAPVPVEEQLAFLCAEEGHPDNVTPALLGGLCVVGFEGERLHHLRLAPPEGLAVALCVPDLEVSTPEARRILPAAVSHQDAAFTAGRMAFLMAGLLGGRHEALAIGAQDRLHQDHRASLIGPVEQAFEAARAAGALASFVSGSGSTLASLVPAGGPVQRVAEALCGPFREEGVDATGLSVELQGHGAVVCPEGGGA